MRDNTKQELFLRRHTHSDIQPARWAPPIKVDLPPSLWVLSQHHSPLPIALSSKTFWSRSSTHRRAFLARDLTHSLCNTNIPFESLRGSSTNKHNNHSSKYCYLYYTKPFSDQVRVVAGGIHLLTSINALLVRSPRKSFIEQKKAFPFPQMFRIGWLLVDNSPCIAEKERTNILT